MNKNTIKRRKYLLSRSSNQYPWNLSKLKNSLKKRKWFRIKFSENLLKNRKFFRYKQLTTYENKTKSLFRKFFAPGVTNTQFKKLFKFKNRYRSTFRKVLNLEHRFDTLVYRIYMIQNVHIARFCITNNFFRINSLSKSEPTIIIRPGDIIELSTKKIWNIFYSNILKIVSSIKKYYNRVLFKISYPFIPTRKHRLFKEDGWKKKKSVRFLLKRFKLKYKIYIRKSKYLVIRKTRKFLCARRIGKVYKTISYNNKKITKSLLKFNPKRPYKKRKPAYLMKKSYNLYNFINPIKPYLKKNKFIKKKIDTRYKKKSLFLKKNLKTIKVNKINTLNLKKVRPVFKLNKKSKKNKKVKHPINLPNNKYKNKLVKPKGININYQIKLMSETAYKLYKKSLLKKKLLYSFIRFYKKSKLKKVNKFKLYSFKINYFFKFFYSKEFYNLRNKADSNLFKLNLDLFLKKEKFKASNYKHPIYRNLSHFYTFKETFKYKKEAVKGLKKKYKIIIKSILYLFSNKKKVFFIKSPIFYKLFKNYQKKFLRLSRRLKNKFRTNKLPTANLNVETFLIKKKSNLKKKINLKKRLKLLIKIKKDKPINYLKKKQKKGLNSKNLKKNKKKRLKAKNLKKNKKKTLKYRGLKNKKKGLKIKNPSLLKSNLKKKFKKRFKFLRKRPYWWKRNWVHFYWQHRRVSKKFFIFNEFRKKFNNSFKLFKTYKSNKLSKQVNLNKNLIKILPYLYLRKKNKLMYFNSNPTNLNTIIKHKFSKTNHNFLKHFLNVSLISTHFIKTIIFLNLHINNLPNNTKKIKLLNNFINNIFQHKTVLNTKKLKKYIIFLLLININFYELLKFKRVLKKSTEVLQISAYKNNKVESLCKTKRKYLLIKSFFRKFNNKKVEIMLNNKVYKPIQIKYKKIDLSLKYRPFPIYYIETNYNTLSFSITSEFDFLHYPYKTLLDFNSISYFYSR